MVTARSFAVKNRYEIDPNQEFIALGVADIGAGLLQGFAISGADSRTAVNDSVGGKSQVTGLVAAGLLVLVLLFLTGAAGAAAHHRAGRRADQRGHRTVRSARPRHACGGSAARSSACRSSRCSASSPSACCPASLVAVGAGAAAASGQGVAPARRRAGTSPERPGLPRHHEPSRRRDRSRPGDLPLRRRRCCSSMPTTSSRGSGPSSTQAQTEVRCFLLDAETMPLMDTTGAASLEELCAELAERGIVFGHRRRQGAGPRHARSDRADAADWRRTSVPHG